MTKDAEGPDGFASIGVAFGSVAAHIERREQTDGGDGRLIVRVPQDAIQTAKIQVISSRGVASNALDFEPVAPILTVDPPSAAPGDELIVRTQGIRIPTTDESEPKVRVGAYAAEHLERQPGGEDELLIKLSLPKQMPLGAAELVVFTAAGAEVGRTKLEVTSGVEIESVSPPRIILGQNEPIQVFGRGFIADGGRATQHNRIELDRRQLQVEWRPTLAVVRLPGTDPAALAAQGFVENRQAEIVVFNDRGQASPPYQVTLEAP